MRHSIKIAFKAINTGDLFMWRDSIWMKATEHTAVNFNHPSHHGVTSIDPDTIVETA